MESQDNCLIHCNLEIWHGTFSIVDSCCSRTASYCYLHYPRTHKPHAHLVVVKFSNFKHTCNFVALWHLGQNCKWNPSKVVDEWNGLVGQSTKRSHSYSGQLRTGNFFVRARCLSKLSWDYSQLQVIIHSCGYVVLIMIVTSKECNFFWGF